MDERVVVVHPGNAWLILPAERGRVQVTFQVEEKGRAWALHVFMTRDQAAALAAELVSSAPTEGGR